VLTGGAAAMQGSAELASDDVSYAFGYQSAMCFDCAVRRGGSYDAVNERWATLPRIDDLFRGAEPREY
jgi:hypothetical protein